MTRVIKFRHTVPRGMRILEQGVDICGQGCHNAARKFARQSKRRVYLRRESDGGGHPGSVRVIGVSQGWFREQRKCIGYVPEEVAKRLVKSGIEDTVKARLQMIAFDKGELADLRIDLFGSEEEFSRYK